MPVRVFAILVFALALSACAGATTKELGSTINADGTLTAPGSNTLQVTFNENGVPRTAQVTSFKDEDNIMMRVRYPDGTEWLYTADKSTGIDQTKARTAVQQALAEYQATTAQKLGPDAIKALESTLLKALGLVG